MPDTECRIRDAELDDAPELAVPMCKLGYETKRPEMETRLKVILCNPAYRTFVAVMGGRMCGRSPRSHIRTESINCPCATERSSSNA
jgi:hypothetical protein